MSHKKVLVIGIDGGTWNVLADAIIGDFMPTLRRILVTENCRCAFLRSTLPPDSIPAWPSLVTGKNPGKHGAFSFLDRNLELVNSTMIKSVKLWEYLSLFNIRSCVINVPSTYPASSNLINDGFIITSWLTPPASKDFVYPPSLRFYLEEKRYIIDISTSYKHFGFEESVSKYRYEVADILEAIMLRRSNIVADLLKNYDCDFIFIVFTETDMLQHLLWDDKKRVLKFYKVLDKAIHNIVRVFNEMYSRYTRYLFFVSDHGFNSIQKVNINLYPVLLKVNSNLNNNLLNSVLLSETLSIVHYRLFKQYSGFLKPLLSAWHSKSKINSKDQLFILQGNSIYISNKIFSKLKLKQNIVTAINSLFSNILKAYHGNDVYHGPYVNDGPDIVVEIKNPLFGLTMNSGYNLLYLPVISSLSGGHHASRNGILIICGPNILKDRNKVSKSGQNNNIYLYSIYDIFPTIAKIYGLPLIDDLDGKIINIFNFNNINTVGDMLLNTSELNKIVIRKRIIQKLKTAHKDIS